MNWRGFLILNSNLTMQKHALIVAGGSGTRMGSATPKQFLDIKGQPVFIHTLKAFLEAYPDMDLIVVFPEVYVDEGQRLIHEALPGIPVRITTGGTTRFHSVLNGLKKVTEHSIVFVHDAVRCLVTPDLIRRCYEAAVRDGSAIPVVPVRDSLRRRFGEGSEVVDREGVVQVQTPQTFRADILLNACRQPYHPSFTDEATVVESSGVAVHLVEGEETNLKLTLPADLVMAEMIWDRRQA
jgi:2-C-methyl-D-erythritol 4-phosphate cytidylyltransferase